MRKEVGRYIALCPNARRLEELFVDRAKYIVALDGKQEKYQQLLDSPEREAGIIADFMQDSKIRWRIYRCRPVTDRSEQVRCVHRLS